MQHIYYTDGSCMPNPGKGGFAVVDIFLNENNEEEFFDSYYEKTNESTNNREELKAVLWVMENKSNGIFKDENFIKGTIPLVYSDSAYVVNCFNDWIFKWRDNGWKRSKNQSIENLDLMKKFIELYDKGYRIDLKRIPGHSGHKWNELADKIAKGEN